jgi:hypothetical protein
MCITGFADNFHAAHAVLHVFMFSNHIIGYRRKITRPTAASIKLGVACKQGCVAAHAVINAELNAVPVAAGERALGSGLARDAVVQIRQLFTPLRIGFNKFGHRAMDDEPFVLSLSKHLLLMEKPFDKLRANVVIKGRTLFLKGEQCI